MMPPSLTGEPCAQVVLGAGLAAPAVARCDSSPTPPGELRLSGRIAEVLFFDEPATACAGDAGLRSAWRAATRTYLAKGLDRWSALLDHWSIGVLHAGGRVLLSEGTRMHLSGDWTAQPSVRGSSHRRGRPEPRKPTASSALWCCLGSWDTMP